MPAVMSSPGIRALLAKSIVVVGLVAVSPAAADTSRADGLFQQGRTAAMAGDYVTARAKFIESQRLDPAVGTLLNIADCEEHLAHPAAALAAFRFALPQLDSTDARHAITKDRIATLEKRAPKLTVSLPAGAPRAVRVLRDGVPLSPRDFGVPTFVEPGLHLVTMESGDGPAQTVNVLLKEGQNETVTLDPSRLATEPVARTGPRQSDREGSTQLHLGIVALGVGAAGLAVAGLSWAQLSSNRRTLDRACDTETKLCSGGEMQAALDAQDAGRTWSIVNYAAWGVGAAGLATGAILLLTRSERSSRVTVVAGPLPGGGNLGARATF